ncbi:purine-nucleoside phosphorylase [Desulforegula conservatrix]|uniref:purine-nucleoside phosphorylase n=1 Tax=Desulforegula conservatrix TaxID=153026 RepID=UPI00040C9EDC|nr:purine-nucleoside phosphorylase [Desulforegula conservatrix]
MEEYVKKVKETAAFIKKNISEMPVTGLLTGTGLGDSVAGINVLHAFDYKDIPNFPVSTVESHKGKLIFGDISGHRIVAMQGRFHMYEGYSPLEVTFPIRVMQELGVQNLIVTNAAGGLNLSFSPGDIMLIRDHINMSGENPLIGPNVDSWGVRFPDMSAVYDLGLAAIALDAAIKHDLDMFQGVYVGLKGPSLETPAETRFIRMIGADAVGFSTIPEIIVAVHAGMKVLGLSTITNVNDPDHQEKATVEEIIDVAVKAAPKVALIIKHVLETLEL